MTYVVAEPCIKCKFTSCVGVCPAECFHEGRNFMVINPNECIDCGACVPECPASAIFSDHDLPNRWADYRAINETMARKWPLLREKKLPLQNADRMKDFEDKRSLLDLA